MEDVLTGLDGWGRARVEEREEWEDGMEARLAVTDLVSQTSDISFAERLFTIKTASPFLESFRKTMDYPGVHAPDACQSMGYSFGVPGL